MSSEVAFTLLVALVAVERFVEIRRSSEDVAQIEAHGGEELWAREKSWLRMLHAGWIASMLIEVYYIGRPFLWPLAAVSLAAVLAGTFLWLRRSSYAGLVLEVIALPLVHTAWVTAVIFTVAALVIVSRPAMRPHPRVP